MPWTASTSSSTPGEIIGFLGPNGAGKSTTVRMLTTLLKPTAGRAFVAGHDVVAEAAEVRRSIGVALQDAAIDPLMTGRELLRLQGTCMGSDWLFGELGNDVVNGGPAEDVAYFFPQGSDREVTADLSRGRANGEGNDRLIRIEDLGSNSDGHTLRGDGRANKLYDSFEGVGDGDVLAGRGGNDILLASRGEDIVRGGAGDDVIGFRQCDCGGDSNDDVFGGPGIDTIDYSFDPFWRQFAVTVDLAAGSAEGEAINSDSIASIENIVGTESADELAGDDRANQVVGGIGDDALFGRGGDDLLDGGDGADSVDGGEGLDSCLNGEKQTACES